MLFKTTVTLSHTESDEQEVFDFYSPTEEDAERALGCIADMFEVVASMKVVVTARVEKLND